MPHNKTPKKFFHKYLHGEREIRHTQSSEIYANKSSYTNIKKSFNEEMDLNPLNKPKRKRTVNKAEWTKEKRKRLRIAGKEYINAKGEVVPEKQPGPDCKCRRKCYEKVSKANRMKLFKGYYSLQSHDEQNAYLFGLIRKVPIARKRAEGSTRRTCTFNYYIRIGGQETQVCVKALANIHGVGKSKIHILCEKLGQSVLFPRDERGRHSKMPKKVSDETVELVKNHIYSIIHTDKARDFLKDEKANNGPDVNITQMHKDFLDIYDPEYREELANYENRTFQQSNFDFQSQEYRHHLCFNENDKDPQQNVAPAPNPQPIQPPQAIRSGAPTTIANKKKRKTMKDGRPEPLIRQWYYSKIFHDIYTTKEAIALRKKIISWKCSDDFVFQKPPRKQRKPKKVDADVQQQPHPQQQPQQQQNRLPRLTKGTNTSVHLPQAPPLLPIKKKVQEVQIQNIPLKKKSVQVFQATNPQGQDMYSLYPMTILQDLAQIDTSQAVNLTHAQPLQQTQIRAIAPTHFQATVAQPHCTTNGMAISTGNLQALGVNINLAQTGTQYATNHGIVSYKFE